MILYFISLGSQATVPLISVPTETTIAVRDIGIQYNLLHSTSYISDNDESSISDNDNDSQEEYVKNINELIPSTLIYRILSDLEYDVNIDNISDKYSDRYSPFQLRRHQHHPL